MFFCFKLIRAVDSGLCFVAYKVATVCLDAAQTISIFSSKHNSKVSALLIIYEIQVKSLKSFWYSLFSLLIKNKEVATQQIETFAYFVENLHFKKCNFTCKHNKMLIGSAVRYLAGRNAVQTVYWRTVKDHTSGELRIVKHQKICNFGPKEEIKYKV